MPRLRPLLAAAGLVWLSACGGSGRTLLTTETGISDVAVAGDELWIAHKGQGLLRLPVTGGSPEIFADKSGLDGGKKEVRTVTVDGDSLWLATGAGVVRFSRTGHGVTGWWTVKDGLGADSVRQVVAARGTVWAGTIFGASRLLPGGKRWKNYAIPQGMPQTHVYRLTNDGHTLWASSINGGLVKFDAAHDRWVLVPQVHGVGNKYIYSMANDDTDHSLWLGTAGGVNRYDPAKGWDVPVCESGFTDYSVYGICRTGDTLWFGTTYGLYRRDLKSGTQKILGKSAGLVGEEVVAIAPAGKALYVATKTGVAVIPNPNP
jgi:ligand-binding sensor domain-containing protein